MAALRVIQWTTGKVGNSIPAVCAARPGLLKLRDVGLPYSPVGLWT
jgi:hypothetical protein